jgi:hypothetical protein
VHRGVDATGAIEPERTVKRAQGGRTSISTGWWRSVCHVCRPVAVGSSSSSGRERGRRRARSWRSGRARGSRVPWSQRECSHGLAIIGPIQRGAIPTKLGPEPVQIEASYAMPGSPRRSLAARGTWAEWKCRFRASLPAAQSKTLCCDPPAMGRVPRGPYATPLRPAGQRHHPLHSAMNVGDETRSMPHRQIRYTRRRAIGKAPSMRQDGSAPFEASFPRHTF